MIKDYLWQQEHRHELRKLRSAQRRCLRYATTAKILKAIAREIDKLGFTVELNADCLRSQLHRAAENNEFPDECYAPDYSTAAQLLKLTVTPFAILFIMAACFTPGERDLLTALLVTIAFFSLISATFWLRQWLGICKKS